MESNNQVTEVSNNSSSIPPIQKELVAYISVGFGTSHNWKSTELKVMPDGTLIQKAMVNFSSASTGETHPDLEIPFVAVPIGTIDNFALTSEVSTALVDGQIDAKRLFVNALKSWLALAGPAAHAIAESKGWDINTIPSDFSTYIKGYFTPSEVSYAIDKMSLEPRVDDFIERLIASEWANNVLPYGESFPQFGSLKLYQPDGSAGYSSMMAISPTKFAVTSAMANGAGPRWMQPADDFKIMYTAGVYNDPHVFPRVIFGYRDVAPHIDPENVPDILPDVTSTAYGDQSSAAGTVLYSDQSMLLPEQLFPLTGVGRLKDATELKPTDHVWLTSVIDADPRVEAVKVIDLETEKEMTDLYRVKGGVNEY